MTTRITLNDKNSVTSQKHVFRLTIPGGIRFNHESGILLEYFSIINIINNISSSKANNEIQIVTKDNNSTAKTLDIQFLDGKYSVKDINNNIKQILKSNSVDTEAVSFNMSPVYNRVTVKTDSNTKINFTNDKFRQLLGFSSSQSTMNKNSLLHADNL